MHSSRDECHDTAKGEKGLFKLLAQRTCRVRASITPKQVGGSEGGEGDRGEAAVALGSGNVMKSIVEAEPLRPRAAMKATKMLSGLCWPMLGGGGEGGPQWRAAGGEGGLHRGVRSQFILSRANKKQDGARFSLSEIT